MATLAGTATSAAAQLDKLNIIGAVDLFQPVPGANQNLVVDFLPPLAGGVGVINTFGPQFGVFAILPPLTPGTNLDFVFGPAAAPAPTPAPAAFLTIGGFTFTGLTYGPGTLPGSPLRLTYDGATTFLTLSVRGTVTGPGLLLGGQPFLGSYSTQFPDMTPAELLSAAAAGTVQPSTISASFVVSPRSTGFQLVPEPSTYVLLATGLLGVAAVSRRRKLT